MSFLRPENKRKERDSLAKDVSKFLEQGGTITMLDSSASRGDLSPKEMSNSSALRYKINKLRGAYGN
jgi:hypothetical protein